MSNARKQKLELTWIGKDNRPKLEPRILLEDPAKSYHAKHRVTEDDVFDNKLIFGDNLLALKALEQEFTGKIKCIYIDPPYNTGSAFEHYDDGIEHSLWLTLIRDRLECLRQLLSEDGSIWITIDDNECHYLKIVLDEVFGRSNFLASIAWQKIYTTKNSSRFFSAMHDYILVYAKNKENWTIGNLPRGEKQDSAYDNPDSDSRGPWKATPLHARNPYSQGLYSIETPSGRVISGPPSGTYWRISKRKLKELIDDNRIWWGKSGDGIPAQKRFLSEVKQGVTPSTLWLHQEAGHNGEAKNEIRALFPDKEEIFLTPKPERLIKRILEISSQPGDWVLDSFSGTGTTGAVAHKMGRRWIMIELGEHCHTHIIPRLKKVIDAEDKGGITEAVEWKGGGGFRYYHLAPSLLKTDKWGNLVINKAFNPDMLSEAVCKLEGYTYAPSDTLYWQHGHSAEKSFIYVTTQHLNREQLTQLNDELGSGRSLLVCCASFRGKAEHYPNLEIKKIPKAVLAMCEWGHDDYSLKIENLPQALPPKGQQELFGKSKAGNE
jgi:adenine-specific DNA-methyltransferase